MSRFLRIAARAVLIVVATLVVGLGAYAQQATQAERHSPSVRRSVATPPPLPLDVINAPPGMTTQSTRLRAVPPMPSYAQYLAAKRARRPLSASGGTICVSLASGGTTCAPGATDTQVYPLNFAATWRSSTLPDAAANHYHDYMMAPNQTTPQSVGVAYTGPAGASHAQSLSLRGVYVFGSLNTSTNNWDALAYIVVGGGAHVETFADSNLTTAQQTFTAGNNVYINGFSLTPTDSYAFVVDSTSISGQCVFTFPASVPAAPYAGPCDAGSAKIAGANAAGGNFFATWVTSSSLPGGTYSVTLYDQTTSTRLAQRQIAITSPSATTGISVVGNYTTGGLIGPTNRFAFDGGVAPYQDTTANPVALAAVAGPGLTGGRSYYYVVTDPNGTVVANVAAGGILFGYTASTTIFTLSQAYSPKNFAPNVYTVTLVDRTASNNPPTVLAASTFQVMGYSASVTWDDGTIAANTVTPPVPAAVSKGITYTNDAESHFGIGNADSISKIVTSTVIGGSKYPNVAWTGASSGCTVPGGANTCAQVSATDSNGHAWIAQLVCTGNGCGNTTNAARAFSITSTPVTNGYGLPPNATLTLPAITITDVNGNQCGAGCGFATQIQPLDAPQLDVPGAGSTIANEIDVLDNSSVTYALQAALNIYGTRVGSTIVTGRLVQGDTQATAYQPRYANALYDNGQPRATSIAGIKQILQIALTDASVGAQSITQLALQFPSQFNVSTMSIDTTVSASTWSVIACPSGVGNASTLCVQTSAALTNGGSTSTINIDMDPPATSFSPAAVGVTVLNAPSFAAQASGSAIAVAAGTPATVTPLQLASYSLNSTLMTGAMSPSTVGQGSATPRSQTVGFTFTNTPTSSDLFPDYVDAILFQADAQTTTTLTWPATWTSVPSNWSLLDTWTSGGQTNFLFGLCAAQDSRTAIPSTTLFGQSLSTCTGSPNEATGSLSPGSIFSAQGTASVKAGTGSITGRIFAHGANGNGWSNAIPVSLSVTNADSASAGFAVVNGSPVANGSQPTVGGDPSSVNGSSFQYVVNNTGNTNITQISVKIPGPDISGASDQEASGPYFFITSTNAAIKSALAYSGSGGALTPCTTVTVTQPVNAGSPITTTPGSMVLSGCSIPPGYSVTIPFNAKSPATVNSTYQFSTTFNGTASNVAANEQWFADTQLKITLSATLTIQLAPTGTGPSGTASPAYACAASSGPSTANLTTNLDFGTVPVGVTETCTDGVLVSVATNAGGTVGWNLYVTADGNPSNVVQFQVDSARSSTGNSVTFSNNAGYGAVGLSTPGQTLATRASGVAATRTPFDVVTSWRVAPVDALPHTQYLTFTFIAQ